VPGCLECPFHSPRYHTGSLRADQHLLTSSLVPDQKRLCFMYADTFYNLLISGTGRCLVLHELTNFVTETQFYFVTLFFMVFFFYFFYSYVHTMFGSFLPPSSRPYFVTLKGNQEIKGYISQEFNIETPLDCLLCCVLALND
jgi:hypothetical protein